MTSILTKWHSLLDGSKRDEEIQICPGQQYPKNLFEIVEKNAIQMTAES